MTAVHAVSAIRNFDRLFIGPPRERCGQKRRLTVKLRGRTEAPALGAEGAQFLSARGDKPTTPHGPLQRLLCARAMMDQKTTYVPTAFQPAPSGMYTVAPTSPYL